MFLVRCVAPGTLAAALSALATRGGRGASSADDDAHSASASAAVSSLGFVGCAKCFGSLITRAAMRLRVISLLSLWVLS